MDQTFREIFEALSESAEANSKANEYLAVAHLALGRSNIAMKKAMDSVMIANNDHEELKDSVARLEVIVLNLMKQIKEQN